jgi:rhodanese-related sulfurtransferase
VERWLEFMGNHPILFGTLGVLIVLFFIFEGQRNGRKISPQSLGILVKAKNALLIDLRDSKDFREGHISGSRNIPYSQIASHADELKASDRPLVFICNLGQVAGSALQKSLTMTAIALMVVSVTGKLKAYLSLKANQKLKENYGSKCHCLLNFCMPILRSRKQLLERKGVAYKK